MKRVFSIVAAALMVGLLSAPVFAAGQSRPESGITVTEPTTPLLPAPSSETGPAAAINLPMPQKEWTFAIFLNGDNNLDPFGVEDQNEAAKVGSNDWLNIVSLIDRERGPAQYNYITKGKINKIKDMGELDMGDYKVFIEFVKYIKANFPAKKYAIIFWNHGSGWKLAGHKGITRGISYDDSSNNHITTAQLATAMKSTKEILGKNLDIVCFDACLMQMAEVAYVCRDYCDVIVASEETEPGKGTPYDDALKTLTAKSDAVTFAKAWTKAFCASYNNGSQGYEACTQSALKCSALNGLNDAIDGLAKALMSGKYNNEIAAVLGKVQTFTDTANIDLLHFAKLLKEAVKDDAVQTACDKLATAAKAVILENGNIDASMANAMGIAIYFPAESYSYESAYNDLAFSKDHLWAQMVQDFYKKKTAATVVAALESGDTSKLSDLVANSTNKEINRYVAQEVNFRLFSEGGLPANVTAAAKALIQELLNK